MQIDVKTKEGVIIQCNLYTGDRCVKIAMTEYDYNLLIRDGFFIRDGKTKDSANVWNTTEVYELKKV